LLLVAATLASNLLSGLRLTDDHCGLRALRASVASQLRMTQDQMAHASEFLSLVRKSGVSFVEVPVVVRYTGYSQGKGQSGLQAIRILFDQLFRR
jgi:hypothetical protein